MASTALFAEKPGELLDVPACFEEGVTVGAVGLLDLREIKPGLSFCQELLRYSLASPFRPELGHDLTVLGIAGC